MFTALCILALIALAVMAYGCLRLMTNGNILEWICGFEAFKVIGGLIAAVLTALFGTNE